MSRVAIIGRRAQLADPPRPLADCDFAPELRGEERSRSARLLAAHALTKPEGMERWARLDRYGKALCRVIDLALEPRARPVGPPSGLYVASLDSCTEINAEFDKGLIQKGPRLASPMQFPYTLPGATASEAAMHFQLTGPYMVLPGGPATALTATVAAVDQIVTGGGRILVAAADVLGPATLRGLEESGRLARRDLPPISEGAAAVWLAAPGDDAPGPRLLIDGVLGGRSLDAAGWRDLVAAALARAGVEPQEVVRAVSATVEPAARAAELAGLGRLVGEPRAASCLQIASSCGDAGASVGLFALLSALEEDTPAVVTAGDQGGSICLVAARQVVPFAGSAA